MDQVRVSSQSSTIAWQSPWEDEDPRNSPLDAVLDELVCRNVLAQLRATAVDPLVKPAVRVDTDSLRGREQKQITRQKRSAHCLGLTSRHHLRYDLLRWQRKRPKSGQVTRTRR